MEIIILFLAPLVQLILSALRVTGKIRMHLGGIAALAILLGFIMSFQSMGMVSKNLAASNFRCGMPAVATLFFGFFMTIVAGFLTWGVFYLLLRLKQRNATVQERLS